MKASVLSLEGKEVGEVELPVQFSAMVDSELIKRAVLAIQSAGVQSKAPYILTGRNNTSIYVGSRSKPTMWRLINVEHARKPRLKNRRFLLLGQVAGIPAVVGGPKAHPPKIEKVWGEKINRKEKRLATASAIAATAKQELVKARGHLVPSWMKLPIVVESKFEGIERTKDVAAALEKIGLLADIERVKGKRKVRSGKGKRRGRRHKTGKSLLVVAADASKVFRACRNLSGVDVASTHGLNADLLAPGALPGRLTLWTEKAIRELAEGKENETRGFVSGGAEKKAVALGASAKDKARGKNSANAIEAGAKGRASK